MSFSGVFALRAEVNRHSSHCQTTGIILTLIQSACAHSLQGEIRLSAWTAADNKSAVWK